MVLPCVVKRSKRWKFRNMRDTHAVNAAWFELSYIHFLGWMRNVDGFPNRIGLSQENCCWNLALLGVQENNC